MVSRTAVATSIVLSCMACGHATTPWILPLAVPMNLDVVDGDQLASSDAPVLAHLLGTAADAGRPPELTGLRVAFAKSMHRQTAASPDGYNWDRAAAWQGVAVRCANAPPIKIRRATYQPSLTTVHRVVAASSWDYTQESTRTFCLDSHEAEVVSGAWEIGTAYAVELEPLPAGAGPCGIDEKSASLAQMPDGSLLLSTVRWGALALQSKAEFCLEARQWLRAHCPEEPQDAACPDWSGLTPQY